MMCQLRNSSAQVEHAMQMYLLHLLTETCETQVQLNSLCSGGYYSYRCTKVNLALEANTKAKKIARMSTTR